MRRRNRGFSRPEIRVVVVLLAVLLAVILPQLRHATGSANDTATSATLAYIRGQLELFRAQHTAPPQNGTLWALLQTTSNANETATAAPVGKQFGPYFHGVPLNVFNNQTAVSPLSVDANSGWYYKADAVDYEFRIRNADGTVNYKY